MNDETRYEPLDGDLNVQVASEEELAQRIYDLIMEQFNGTTAWFHIPDGDKAIVCENLRALIQRACTDALGFLVARKHPRGQRRELVDGLCLREDVRQVRKGNGRSFSHDAGAVDSILLQKIRCAFGQPLLTLPRTQRGSHLARREPQPPRRSRSNAALGHVRVDALLNVAPRGIVGHTGSQVVIAVRSVRDLRGSEGLRELTGARVFDSYIDAGVSC